MALHASKFHRPMALRVVEHKQPKQKLVKFWDEAKLFNDLNAIKIAKRKAAVAWAPTIMSIGVFLSLAFVVLIFEWRTYEKAPIVNLMQTSIIEEDFLDIPPTQQPPPEVKVLQQPNIVEVKDVEEIIEEIKVDFDLEITEDAIIEMQEVIDQEKPEEEAADEVFTIVEVAPAPKNGLQNFFSYIYQNINYPRKAINAQVQGKVFVQFVVNADGTLVDFEVVKGIGMGCDEEAVRVLQSAPAWNPGKQRGKPVRVRMILPINFIIREK